MQTTVGEAGAQTLRFQAERLGVLGASRRLPDAVIWTEGGNCSGLAALSSCSDYHAHRLSVNYLSCMGVYHSLLRIVSWVSLLQPLGSLL